MATAYILYNKKAGSSNNFESVKDLELIINDSIKYIDVCDISNYRTFINGLNKDDYIILAGGDGTINRFVNNIENIDFDNKILYFPNGTGNDYAHDRGYSKESTPFLINDDIKDLPIVTVKNKSYRFLNGVGYGIDGYCCEVGDKLKEIPGKKINYTAIAIKGLLFHYKPTNARVTVDGKTKFYKKVWIAPTMNGRYYGGGMMPTPDQKRNSGLISTMIFHNSSKLKTLTIFPSIFKGTHVKNKKYVEILEGKEITVEFDRPVSLQIDGETILDVSSYTASVSKKESLKYDTSLKEYAI